MIKRILGKFPIFGSKASLGDLKTLSGKVYTEDAWETPANSDMINYLQGFHKSTDCDDGKIDPKMLNGIFNYLSHAIGYLYERGVAEYTLNMSYPKGAVVSFDGNLYLSKSDNNVQHPSQSLFWDRLNVQNSNKSEDLNPIGTLLTVPHTFKKDGYIDFEQGATFNKTLYPELYKVLGTNQFGITSTSTDHLPVGTVIYSLNSSIPDGWVEWKTAAGNLRNYPELIKVFSSLLGYLPIDKQIEWREAINNLTFPQFGNGLFLKGITGYSAVGEYNVDSLPSQAFNILPVVVDPSNTLNPIGISRTLDEQIIAPVSAVPAITSNVNAPVVLIGQRAEVYSSINPKQITVDFAKTNSGTEVSPKHLTMRVLVKAKTISSNVPSTHKQIIKAY